MSEMLQPDGSATPQPLYVPIKRRSFFMYAGATAGATALLLSSCDDDDETTNPNLPVGNSTTADGSISLGSGDVGVLNYAYALEQLEADFYAKVAANASGALSGTELDYFRQVAAHEAIHRDFFKKAITSAASAQLLRNLTPKYPNGTFDTRTSILNAARDFEDLGVAAYNGAGKLIQKADYLLIAGKIVSVEARHAAYVRDLISPGSFASNADTSGLDVAKTPTEVLNTAKGFITEKIDGSKVGAR